MLRISFVFVVAVVFSFSEAYAGRGKTLLNNNEDVCSSPLKRQKISKEEKVSLKRKSENFDSSSEHKNLKRQKPLIEEPPAHEVPVFSSSVTSSPIISRTKKIITEEVLATLDNSITPFSPTTQERKIFSPIRRVLAHEEYKTKDQKKTAVGSPIVRKLFHDQDLTKHGMQCVQVEGKKVYQAGFLFDPYAEVVTEGKWITNLERTKKGLCPIGHKGIVTKEERQNLTVHEIKERQRFYRIELHHMIQKDTGTDEDPICEATYAAHMGKNARMILEFNAKTKTVEIVHTGLTKAEALKLCKEGQFIVTNTLHFRKGASLIDRESFNTWKEKYWKNRAADFEKGNFIEKYSTSKYDVSTYTGPGKLIYPSEAVKM